MRPLRLFSASAARRMKTKKKKQALKKCLRFHVASESLSFPLQAWFFRFIWQTLMLPKSQRLHCSEDLLGKSKNIDLYRCRNTVQESESIKYTWRRVDAVVCLFIWKALNMISIGNLEEDDKANIEMRFYAMGVTEHLYVFHYRNKGSTVWCS